ncbi:MAG: acyltransferase family protein [Candidatus Marinimicrobia bacterium]|nr:acyltransferase family protein [Candidatus Neomarinimicrobiota bacterium]
MDRQRIYTFDIVKGIAILFVIPLHALIYQIGKNDPTLYEPIISNLSREILFVLAPIVLLSLWGPIFTLITGANIAYGFLRVYKRNPDDSSAYILRRILTASLLIFVARMAVFIFEDGIIQYSTSNTVSFRVRYYADTLDSIALINIIVPLFILFIINHGRARFVGKSKEELGNSIKPRHIYIGLGIITALWFLFTPVVHTLKPYVEAVTTKHNWKLLLFIYSKLTNGRFRFFPVLGFGYIGAIIGAAIHYQEKYQNIRRYTVLFFIIALLSFIVWCFLTENPIGDVSTDNISIMFMILILGSMALAMVLMLGRFDFCPDDRRERRIKRTLFVRRFSIVTLTIYIMEFVLAYCVYLFFEWYWETAVQYVNQVPVLTWGLTQIFTFMLIVSFIWVVIVKFWEKVDFIGSLEWMTIKLGAMFRGEHHIRINSQWILYGHRDKYSNI